MATSETIIENIQQDEPSNMSEPANTPPQKSLLELRPGDVLNGLEITHIHAQNRQYIIYSHTGGFAYLTVNIDRSKIDGHYEEMNRVMGDLYNWVPFNHRRAFYSELGHLLKRIYDQHENPPSLDIFEGISKAIRHYACARARELYLLGATIGILGIATLLYILSISTSIDRTLLSGIICGSMGALVSVLIRAGKLDIELRSPKRTHIIQGCIRLSLGALFGTFAIFAIKADLLLSIAKENEEMIYVFAFLAGFSERFVPELLQSLESASAAHGTARDGT